MGSSLSPTEPIQSNSVKALADNFDIIRNPFMQSIFEHSNTGVIVTDLDDMIQFANKIAEQNLNLDAASLAGKCLRQFFDQQDLMFFLRQFEQLKSHKKQNINIEKKILCEGGEIKTWNMNVQLIDVDSRKNIMYVFHDVTEHKKSLESVQKYKRDFLSSLESLSDAYAIFDVNGMLIHQSSQINQIFPHTIHQFYSDTGIQQWLSRIIYSGEVLDAIGNEENYLNEWITNHKSLNYKFFFKHRNKNYYMVQTSHLDDQIILTFSDVTQVHEKDQLLATLSSENNQLSEAIQSTNAAIIICDALLPDYPIIFANKAFAKLTEWHPAESIGSNLRIIFDEFSDASATQKINGSFENATPIAVELQTCRKDKTRFWSLLQINPIFDANGDCTHYVVILSDITERKLQELEIVKARNAADEASKAKSQFLSVMSHEMKTPINGIMGMMELLMGTPLEPEQSEFLNTARESSENLLRLVNDILDYSNLEYNRLVISPAATDMNEFVKKILVEHRDHAANKKLALQFQPDMRIPKQLFCDRERIAQILNNLVGNAIKFSERGSIEVELKFIQDKQDQSTIQIVVSDTGIGIPQDKIDSIFKPFHQIDFSSTRKYGGTGLGLAICHKLVQLMNGHIKVESKHGFGTTFKVTIDLLKKAVSSATGTKAKQSERRNIKKKILIVDDSPTNRMVVSSIIKNMDFEIDHASNGKEALDKCFLKNYDLIVMDIGMPVMDGITATQKIRSQLEPYRNTPIIALTANSLPDEKNKCLAAGMTEYHSKPVNKTAFIESIAKNLNLSGNRQGDRVMSLLDESVLLQLKEDVGADVLSSLLQTFIDETIERLDIIRDLCKREQWDALGKEGHTLKSTCGSFGLMPLHLKAKMLDESCRQKKIEEARTLCAEIPDMGQKAIGVLRNWIESHPA